ncbi:hypothetical protein EXN66_Car010009 [Channa argus]|uniref:Uncharacterized protein n=1 Tax=Channa argus TaxID=215402 RepID=A0A6G1PVX4_CHAAH|nr:hypothetical protein EXN66_Car010009 [Channa argus]
MCFEKNLLPGREEVEEGWATGAVALRRSLSAYQAAVRNAKSLYIENILWNNQNKPRVLYD